MICLKNLIYIILLLLMYSCSLDNRKKDFYDVSGGYTDIRIPLIKPYVLSRGESNPEDTFSNRWHVNLVNCFGIIHIRKIDVQDSIIYIRSGNIDNFTDGTTLCDSPVANAWYILNLKNKTEIGFDNEIGFKKEVIKNNYPNPRWQNLDSLSKAIGKAGKLPWDPRKLKN